MTTQTPWPCVCIYVLVLLISSCLSKHTTEEREENKIDTTFLKSEEVREESKTNETREKGTASNHFNLRENFNTVLAV